MSNSKLLRRCYDFVEAEGLRTRLDAAGILAVINGAEAHITFSYLGLALGGVRLEVAPEDYDRAIKLLEEDEHRAAALGPWICQTCNEQNEATFEVCWHCNKPRDEGDWEGRLPEQDVWEEPPSGQPVVEPSSVALPDDPNPYRPILIDEPSQQPGPIVADATTNETVRRAYIAATVGIIIIPPLLNIYSVALLMTSSGESGSRNQTDRRRVFLAWIVNIISIIGWLLFWFSMGGVI